MPIQKIENGVLFRIEQHTTNPIDRFICVYKVDPYELWVTQDIDNSLLTAANAAEIWWSFVVGARVKVKNEIFLKGIRDLRRLLDAKKCKTSQLPQGC